MAEWTKETKTLDAIEVETLLARLLDDHVALAVTDDGGPPVLDAHGMAEMPERIATRLTRLGIGGAP